MPRKKKDELEEGTQAEATPEATATSEDTSVEAQGADAAEGSEPTVVGSIIDAVSDAVETAASTVVGGVADAFTGVASTVGEAVGLTGGEGDSATAKTGRGNRAQRVGVVTSDKMTKTVVVRVDRLVKHPKYRRYVRRKKQFMAHDELGAGIGDKVRIIETRPLSARKRWRVIEIVQKAAK
jgi:small subunit ribosomal protein S17